jgi:hypothetical protein
MSSKRKRRASYDTDWGWVLALEQLQQFLNRDAVLALLADGAPVPDWARKEIAQWRAGNRPPRPSDLSDNDKRLLVAVAAIGDPTQKQKNESRDERIERIAREYGFDPRTLRAFLNSRGGLHRRVIKDWAEWERIYCDPSFALGPDRP